MTFHKGFCDNRNDMLDTSEADELWRTVQDLKSSQLKEGEIWCLISAEWYSGYAKSKQDRDAKHTEISGFDNSILGLQQNAANFVLQDGLIEGVDYVLIPIKGYDMREKEFGGGPRIERQVVMLPGLLLQVEVYPLRIRLHQCDSTGAVATSPLIDSMLLSKMGSINDFLEMCKREHHDLVKINDSRFWLKQKAPEVQPVNAVRRLLPDVTDVDDSGWRYLRPLDYNVILSEIIDNCDVVDGVISILVEANIGTESEPSWPRQTTLENWKYALQKGDRLDAIDADKKWWESEVVEIKAEASIENITIDL